MEPISHLQNRQLVNALKKATNARKINRELKKNSDFLANKCKLSLDQKNKELLIEI